MAEAGANVALVSRTKSALEETASIIRDYTKAEAYILPADITDRQEVERAIEELVSRVERLDILVNNAGMNIRTPALDVTDSQWDTIVQTNLKSGFLASQIAGRYIKDHGGGRIFNISSVGGHTALRTGVVYGATKAAIIHMTRVLALVWGKYGIHVNSVEPWYIRTPLRRKYLVIKRT